MRYLQKLLLSLFSFFYFVNYVNAEIVTEANKIEYPEIAREQLRDNIVRLTMKVESGKIVSIYFYEPFYLGFKEEVEKKIKDWKYSEDGVYNIWVDFRIIKTRCSYFKIKRKKWIFFTKNFEIESCGVGSKLNDGYAIYEKTEKFIDKGIFFIKIDIVVEDPRAQK